MCHNSTRTCRNLTRICHNLTRNVEGVSGFTFKSASSFDPLWTHTEGLTSQLISPFDIIKNQFDNSQPVGLPGQTGGDSSVDPVLTQSVSLDPIFNFVPTPLSAQIFELFPAKTDTFLFPLGGCVSSTHSSNENLLTELMRMSLQLLSGTPLPPNQVMKILPLN